MNIFESFRSAISSIFSNKMRSVLTTLGIIIGIVSVIVITSIGKGFENQINSQFASINSETVSVQTSYGETIRDKDKLNLKDVENIKKLANVELSSPNYSTNVLVSLKNPKETKDATFYGTNEDLKEINKIEMLFGRYINENDLLNKANVCVIDNSLAKEIFGREDALGEKINIKNIFGTAKELNLEIIGIYKNKQEGEFRNNRNL